MRRSTTMKMFGFCLVALSCGAVACAASGGGGGGGTGSGGGLQSGDGGGDPGTGMGTGGTTPGVGGTTPGVGGTTPGVGGTTGGGTVPATYPGTPSAPTMTVTGGHVVSGDWQGYAYTWKGMNGLPEDDVRPVDFAAATDLCVWGHLGMSYDSVLGFGFGTNQLEGEMDKGEWSTSGGSGVAYNLTNDGGTPLRVYVNAVGVADSFCAEITGTSGTLAWDNFNTACWDGSGETLMAGAAITDVGVMAPGDEAAARDPAFCVVSLSIAP